MIANLPPATQIVQTVEHDADTVHATADTTPSSAHTVDVGALGSDVALDVHLPDLA